MNIPIYVISALHGREKHLLRTLTEANLSYKVISAVFFEKYPMYFNSARSLLLDRERLTLPELGAARAHLDAYSDLIQTNHSFALIFEDDAKIVNLSLLLEKCQDFQRLMKGKPYLLLNHCDHAVVSRFTEIIPGVFSVIKYPSSAVCYLISKQAAFFLLEKNSNLDFRPDFPKDFRVEWFVNTAKTIEHDFENSYLQNLRDRAKQRKLVRFITLVCELSLINFILLKIIDPKRQPDYLRSIWYPKFFYYLTVFKGKRPFSSQSCDR